ncbi:c-type cytochrome [Altererythrobacter sp. H2]|uniref:c-type cytochrome n=1 Tax=Altererythrobacter sp. H2 TaxID=3108391 RepID=UPI002B4BDB55|nr:c-type cytochrome [Altererythrobacter sp. H2]WRK95717.1 c-type cytochrome [Altererythrobacter sp. H2]
MDDRFNTAAGWALFAGIVGLGASIASGMYFEAGNPHSVEAGGYPIEDVDGGADAGEAVVDLGTILASADVALGEQQAAARCGNCHTFNQGGANGTGPNLYGVMGLPIGKHAAGFNYSADLSGKGGNWTWEAMNSWLLAPKQFAAGTTMGFAGLKDDNARASIILYLNSLGSNLPLPAPAAAAAEPALEGEAPAEGTPAEGADAVAAEVAPAAEEAPAAE